MQRILRNLLIFMPFVITLALSSPLHAQEPAEVSNESFGVVLSVPGGWGVDAAGGDSKVVASFTQSAIAAKIELLGTRVIRDEHALVLFDAFKEQLASSGFVSTVAPQELEFGAYKGTLEEFDFSNADVSIRVLVFCFVQRSVAYVAVAYVARAERESARSALEAVVASLRPQTAS